jgi:hypothetical protein
MRPIVLAAAFVLAAVSGSAAAQVYKWTDENGKVHYGDKPQGARPAAKVAAPASGVQPANAGSAASAEECHTITCQGMRAEERRRAAQAEEQKRNTQAARSQLRSTPSGPSAAERERAAAVEKCKANRGVDCDKPGAINQWVQQDRPMTAQQQRDAVAARQAREAAARRY